MRNLLILTFVLGACASPSPEGEITYPSVRDHLAHATDLFVQPATSGGALTASRWSHDGWIGGDVALTIDHGDVAAKVDPDGQLELTRMRLVLAPIDVPQTAVGVAARLDHLQLDLDKRPTAAPTIWRSDNDTATASTELSLLLSWSVTIDGTTTALGPQHLPPIPTDITLDGDHKTVDATFTLDLPDTVWNWADLIDLRDLRLVVDSSGH